MKNLIESFYGTCGAKVDVYGTDLGTIVEYFDVNGSFLMEKTYNNETNIDKIKGEANAWVQSRSVLNG
jgi:hypothetical protein